MMAWRFLPLLVLCCALDLAVPVAPTPGGVEFEDDEEVLQTGAWRAARPEPREARAPVAPSAGPAERVRLGGSSVRAIPRRALAPAHVTALEARPSDTGAASPPSSEDH